MYRHLIALGSLSLLLAACASSTANYDTTENPRETRRIDQAEHRRGTIGDDRAIVFVERSSPQRPPPGGVVDVADDEIAAPSSVAAEISSEGVHERRGQRPKPRVTSQASDREDVSRPRTVRGHTRPSPRTAWPVEFPR